MISRTEQARESRRLGGMIGEGWGVRIVCGPGQEPVMNGAFFESPFLPSLGYTIAYNRRLYRVTSAHIDYDENEIVIWVERIEQQSQNPT